MAGTATAAVHTATAPPMAAAQLQSPNTDVRVLATQTSLPVAAEPGVQFTMDEMSLLQADTLVKEVEKVSFCITCSPSSDRHPA